MCACLVLFGLITVLIQSRKNVDRNLRECNELIELAEHKNGTLKLLGGVEYCITCNFERRIVESKIKVQSVAFRKYATASRKLLKKQLKELIEIRKDMHRIMETAH